MALSTAVVTVKQVWFDGKMLHILGTLAIGAGPLTYNAGGIVMALNDELIKAQRAPQKVSVTGITGYEYRYVNGTDNTNGLLMIFGQKNAASTGDPLVEIGTSATAIPAAVSGDTIQFEAMFLGQN